MFLIVNLKKGDLENLAIDASVVVRRIIQKMVQDYSLDLFGSE
jgi:hypothetical protein